MDAKTIEAVTAKTNDLLAAPSCNPKLKTAANAWLAAADKDAETPAYIDALTNGVSTIDELLGLPVPILPKRFLAKKGPKASWLMPKIFRPKVPSIVTARPVRLRWLYWISSTLSDRLDYCV